LLVALHLCAGGGSSSPARRRLLYDDRIVRPRHFPFCEMPFVLHRALFVVLSACCRSVWFLPESRLRSAFVFPAFSSYLFDPCILVSQAALIDPDYRAVVTYYEDHIVRLDSLLAPFAHRRSDARLMPCPMPSPIHSEFCPC
jgi:hypothetical protein